MTTVLPEEFVNTPIAHRALHSVADGRPENSLAAIHAAIDHGYGIEIDVQLTSDNKALVFHDYDLTRLTQAIGLVRRRTAADLATIALTGGKAGPPVLGEVLEVIDGQVPLLIELKDQDGALGENVGPLEAAVAKEIEGYQGPVAVMSFNPHSVSAMQTLAPSVPRGLVTDDFEPDVWRINEARANELNAISDYDRVGACFISHDCRDLSMPRVAELKGAGAHILCWTVTSPEVEAEARRIADNITFERYLAPFPT